MKAPVSTEEAFRTQQLTPEIDRYLDQNPGMIDVIFNAQPSRVISPAERESIRANGRARCEPYLREQYGDDWENHLPPAFRDDAA